MKRLLLLTAIFLSGCAAGPAEYDDDPNWIQRADVINKNKLGITIEHSSFGKKIALDNGNTAIFLGSFSASI